MLVTKYRGTFLDIKGQHWLVEILYDQETIIRFPVQLEFDADETAMLEWVETEKYEPLQGSSLSLKVISTNDRMFTELFTTALGKCYCKLYRDGLLYWMGQIDPEQYEEPYTSSDGYTVTLTFSDLGILDRLQWNKQGRMSLRSILDECIDRLGYTDLEILTDVGFYRNISMDNGTIKLAQPFGLEDIYADTANFYDEEGEAMTLREVLEAVFTPFGLRVIQKMGVFHVYTLQELLYIPSVSRPIEWNSTDQVLSVDKVYNKIELTLSRYIPDELLDGGLENALEDEAGKGVLYMTQNWSDDNCLPGFYIIGESSEVMHTERSSELGNIELGPKTSVFRMTSVYSGSDDTGMIWAFKGEDTRNYLPNNYEAFKTNYYDPNDFTNHALGNSSFLANADGGTSVKLCTVRGGYIYSQDNGAIPSYSPNYLYSMRRLCVKLDVLFDVRYNPFESDSEYNEDRNYKNFNEWLNFGYIHADLVIRDGNGKIVAWYDNSTTPKGIKNNIPESSSYNIIGVWYKTSEKPFEAGRYWLSYYDWDDRKKKSGFDGWSTNKRALGMYRKSLPSAWQKIGDGDFVQLPPVSGYIELTIYPDVYTNYDDYPYGHRLGPQGFDYARWLLFRNPSVEIVKTSGKEYTSEDKGDEVISAWLDKNAADELSINLNFYTASGDMALIGRAAILDESGNAFGKYMTTTVLTPTSAEHHLLGFLYSQYAKGHTVLSGSCNPFDTWLLSDRATEGMFFPVSEVYNIREHTSEIKAVELTDEEYEGIEIE